MVWCSYVLMMWWCDDAMMWWCDDVMMWWCDDVMMTVMMWIAGKKFFLAGSASSKKKILSSWRYVWTAGNAFIWCCDTDVLVKKYFHFKNTKNTSPQFFFIFSTTKQRDFIAPFVNSPKRNIHFAFFRRIRNSLNTRFRAKLITHAKNPERKLFNFDFSTFLDTFCEHFSLKIHG